MPDPSSLPTDKPSLRRIMESRRAEACAQNPQAPLALRDHFLKAIKLPSRSVIAGYSARGSEMDPGPLIEKLRADGYEIALPVMAGKGKPLIFRRHDTAMPLVSNAIGIREPGPDAPVVEPDLLLVPLLAFDRLRVRLGTGGGYYDRTLAMLRCNKTVVAVGLAFSCQEISEVPKESHDLPLDRIATELQVF